MRLPQAGTLVGAKSGDAAPHRATEPPLQPFPPLPPLPPLVAVVGPTASGKSGLALELADALEGEIVNTDSQQVYRHFDIGTAKPTADEQARVPHHLLDQVEADESYSAGRYVVDARRAIDGIVARGRVPILCGGTGLYYRALLFGLATVPPVPRDIGARTDAHVAAVGSVAAHGELERVDPEAAAGIHPNDAGRVARALAVHAATGRPLSAYRRAQPFQPPRGAVLTVGLHWDRPALDARIAQRVRQMFERGWIDEVRGLLARGVDPTAKPMQAIGYREIAAWLLVAGPRGQDEREGSGAEYPPQALLEAIARRTRQYAKRQATWFRKHPEVVWAEPAASAGLHERARMFLLASGERR